MLFTVSTPVPSVSEVTLHRHTWYGHIVYGHPEMAGKIGHVKTVASTPTIVYASKTHATNLIFVNDQIGGVFGQPLGVVVDPNKQIIVSAYYNQGLTIPVGYTVIWK